MGSGLVLGPLGPLGLPGASWGLLRPPGAPWGLLGLLGLKFRPPAGGPLTVHFCTTPRTKIGHLGPFRPRGAVFAKFRPPAGGPLTVHFCPTPRTKIGHLGAFWPRGPFLAKFRPPPGGPLTAHFCTTPRTKIGHLGPFRPRGPFPGGPLGVYPPKQGTIFALSGGARWASIPLNRAPFYPFSGGPAGRLSP